MLDGSHFIAGALLGLAGSLHCASVCGGIASSLLMATTRGVSPMESAPALIKIQLGRASSYMLFGAAVGGGGSAFAHLLDLSGLQLLFRMLAGCALVWSGCSVAGIAPDFSRIDNSFRSLMRSRVTVIPASFAISHPVMMGVAWGFAPCGMVYAALLNAMMTGSVGGGVRFMAGFGLATIPVVASTAFGVAAFAGLGKSLQKVILRRVSGGSITAIGVLSLAAPAASLTEICFRP